MLQEVPAPQFQRREIARIGAGVHVGGLAEVTNGLRPLIAGALENGSLDLWDAAKLASGASDAFISRTTKHTGAIKSIEFNPLKPQILATAALTVCLAGTVCGRFVIEQGGLKIKLPSEAAQQHPQGFPVSLANFGSPKYGGELVYAPRHWHCHAWCHPRRQSPSQSAGHLTARCLRPGGG